MCTYVALVMIEWVLDLASLSLLSSSYGRPWPLTFPPASAVLVQRLGPATEQQQTSLQLHDTSASD